MQLANSTNSTLEGKQAACKRVKQAPNQEAEVTISILSKCSIHHEGVKEQTLCQAELTDALSSSLSKWQGGFHFGALAHTYKLNSYLEAFISICRWQALTAIGPLAVFHIRCNPTLNEFIQSLANEKMVFFPSCKLIPEELLKSHELFFVGPTSVHVWPVENGFKTQVAICKPCDPHLTPSCLISSMSDNISRPSCSCNVNNFSNNTTNFTKECTKSWFPLASAVGEGTPLKAALQSLAPLEALAASLANSKKVLGVQVIVGHCQSLKQPFGNRAAAHLETLLLIVVARAIDLD
ncbi:hypothetical protein NC651_034612 [Populus alba x Populus x berolinensis]|nr:hypothetical protein NC651_034612 [Populus alba x Populus x berolinensis]